MKIVSAQYPIVFFENIIEWKKNVKTWIEEAMMLKS